LRDAAAGSKDPAALFCAAKMTDIVASRRRMALDRTDLVQLLADPALRGPHIEIILQIEPELHRGP
jgi:hypothetical protein